MATSSLPPLTASFVAHEEKAFFSPSFIGKANRLRNRLSICQKVTAITLGTMRTIDYRFGEALLKGSFVLAQIIRPIFRFFDDLYHASGCIRIPYDKTHPIHAETINIVRITESLEKGLQAILEDQQAKKTVKEILKDALTGEARYRNTKEFKKSIKAAFQRHSKTLQSQIKEKLHLKDVPLRAQGALERLYSKLSDAADIGYIPLYIKGWCLYLIEKGWNLPLLAEKLKLTSFASHFPYFNLTRLLAALSCAAYASKFFDSISKFSQPTPDNPNQTTRAVWDGVTSLLECAFQLSSCISSPISLWVALLILSKGAGALSIVFRPSVI